jgi:hypothetical protein
MVELARQLRRPGRRRWALTRKTRPWASKSPLWGIGHGLSISPLALMNTHEPTPLPRHNRSVRLVTDPCYTARVFPLLSALLSISWSPSEHANISRFPNKATPKRETPTTEVLRSVDGGSLMEGGANERLSIFYWFLRLVAGVRLFHRTFHETRTTVLKIGRT